MTWPEAKLEWAQRSKTVLSHTRWNCCCSTKGAPRLWSKRCVTPSLPGDGAGIAGASQVLLIGRRANSWTSAGVLTFANTSQIGAFRLVKVAGVYWRQGTNPQLQCLYGLAFETWILGQCRSSSP